MSPSSFQLTVVGSGTVAPSATRTAPAHWVTVGDVRLLMDCGAGTVHRATAFGIALAEVTHVAITHFHADHWGELPHLLTALQWGVDPPRRTPLTVIGPAGMTERLDGFRLALGEGVTEPGYPLELYELAPGSGVALGGGVRLECCRTPHTDHSVAYAVSHAARRLVYTGDTGPSSALATWARGCDLLLAECSCPDDDRLDGHLTPTEAGRLAHAAQAERLVLTHLYPRVARGNPEAIARRVFDGQVTAARDGDQFMVG